MIEKVGDRFQEETKYHRESLKGGMLDWSNKPDIYKGYPDNNKIELPSIDKFELPIKMSLDETLKRRRSIRQFSDQSLSIGQLAYLSWASTGIQQWGIGYELRTVPSAGALYPIETYLYINNVLHIENGLYHYSILRHALEELKRGDFTSEITGAAMDQRMCTEAAAVFIWSAIFFRSKWKYKQRAYRYIYMEAGHIAENLALAATALGLGTCQIGAIFDDELNELIGLDGVSESVIYLSVVGHPETE